MATEVEILCHKAKIDRVSGQVKDGLRWKENQLVVWLTFNEPVIAVSSLAVSLPVKKYERDEFLHNVVRRGAEELKRILAKLEDEEREIGNRQEIQKALDAYAAEAQSLIE